MDLPIPYITHRPRLQATADGYLTDYQTEEFMQATRLFAGLVGGPVVYYGGSVMAREGHPILGNTLRVMGVACSAYHLWQYVSVKMAEAAPRANSRKAKPTAAGKVRLNAIGLLGKALRKQKIIPIPEDAYTLDGD